MQYSELRSLFYSPYKCWSAVESRSRTQAKSSARLDAVRLKEVGGGRWEVDYSRLHSSRSHLLYGPVPNPEEGCASFCWAPTARADTSSFGRKEWQLHQRFQVDKYHITWLHLSARQFPSLPAAGRNGMTRWAPLRQRVDYGTVPYRTGTLISVI